MTIIKKYTAIRVGERKIDGELIARMSFGDIEEGAYYTNNPKTEFDTEDDAIAYAYKQDKYCKWLILPVIRFDD